MAVFGVILSLLCLMTVGCAFGKPNILVKTEEETILTEKIHKVHDELGSRLQSGSNLDLAQVRRMQAMGVELVAEKQRESLRKRDQLENGMRNRSEASMKLQSRRRHIEHIPENGPRRASSDETAPASPPTSDLLENNSAQNLSENSQNLARGTELVKLQKKYKVKNTPATHSGTSLVGKCHLHDIFEDFFDLTVITADFTLGVVTEGALIAADLSICLTQFNPFSLISCFYDLFKTIPIQIRDIVEEVRFFAMKVGRLVPELYRAIGSCFGSDSAKYQMALLRAARVLSSGVDIGDL